MQVELSAISVPRNRMRALGDFAALAQSMGEVGLLNPILLTTDDRLVSGLHRMAAAKSLGWTKIEARRIDLTDLQFQLAEIDENLIRNELTVLERSEHLARRKELYEAIHPETKHGGTPGKAGGGKAKVGNIPSFAEDTSSRTKTSRSTVEQEVKIARSLPEDVKDKIRGTAIEDRKADLLKLSRMDKVEQAKVADKIASGSKSVKDAKKELHREAKAPTKADAKRAAQNWRLIHAECRALDLPAGSVDCIITDPPYLKDFLPCYSDLSRLAAKVLKPGGSCVVMCGQSYLPDVLARIGEHLTYHWTVAYLTPGGQAVQLWDRKVNTFWKPLLWFTNGKSSSAEWQGDVLGSDTNDNDKRFHDWGQSESGMAAIVDRFTFPGQTVLDPFVGGGTTGIVSVRLGRLFIGSDSDTKQIAIAQSRMEKE